MRAMVLEAQGQTQGQPLRLLDVPRPEPRPEQVLIKVMACAVCRTDLHIVDGDLRHPKLPLIPGHEVIGVVIEAGAAVAGFMPGDRVGVPWLGGTCGDCQFCRAGRENLCDNAQFTGYDLDGGFAEYMVANGAYVFPIPDAYDDIAAAPLMCAGLIGFRAFRMIGAARRIGLYGFGAAAHIIAQVACHEGREVHAFTRAGDENGQAFARRLGAVWAGDSGQLPPRPLDAAIIFAPVGALVPAALRAVGKGGKVICAGIHMSDIPAFPYDLLWGEREVRSVANLTREDGIAFLKIAPQVPVKTANHVYPLAAANQALDDLRAGRFEGAAVLTMG
ncbi:MAG: zinc-dependent alcohol dehydrogenase family protein [Rhodospirillaceae bacterium]|nr:zinc-dependent alcohol dehydrogenase family protein [Rhodospirillaceae bacterium]MBT3492569.1 zinc-dependent alcohol dehydrogenase family protein [Rhodospirillaceae bacterium]MBT3782438.1 zinc-dependent alcohol dehydrogenase family protein [Rhodospirillaceae bacterium]MBT3978979.1 zinc-dependent alcohol dehydrogenase family protein [Rhodospirillaceae bacterium]MBT4167181.1 zinc-dependent alcohol dehydrogenase family protein [Rhodospirillaceae bacterium]